MASRVVDYIIQLRDQFSQVAAKVDAAAKKSAGALNQMGAAANTAEKSLNAIKGSPGLSAVAKQADLASASLTRMAAAEATQAKAREAYANKASIGIANMRKEREAAARVAAEAEANASRRSAVTTGIAAGATAVATSAALNAAKTLNPVTNQADLDELLRIAQFRGDLTDAQRKSVRELINTTSVKLGMDQVELARSYGTFLGAGISPDLLTMKDASQVALFERIGLAAKASGENVNVLAENIASLVKQGQFDTSTKANELEAYLNVVKVMALAPQLSPDTMAGHGAGLYQILGLSAMTGKGMDPTERLIEASALQNTLSSLGYRNAQAGHALKTIIQRIQNPTKAALDEIKASGFDIGRVTGVDPEKMAGIDSVLAAMPSKLGLNTAAMRAKLAPQINAAIAADAGLLDVKQLYLDALIAALPKGAKGKGAQAEIKGALDRHFRGGGMDFKALIEEIAKLPPEAMGKVFGIWRAAQSAALSGPQAGEQYDRNKGLVGDRMPTIFAEAERIMLAPESFDLAMKRMSASWQHFRNAVADTGFLDVLSGALGKVTSSVEALSGVLSGATKLEPLERIKQLGSDLGKGDVANGATNWWSSFTAEITKYADALKVIGETIGRPVAGPVGDFDQAGYKRWLGQNGVGMTGGGGGDRAAGSNLPAAAAQQITVRSEVNSNVQVTAPQTVTLTGNLTVSGPGVSGGGNVSGEIPLSATAPRGQTSATTVPGPAVEK